MLIYHFRIVSVDHEDFLREIQIQPKQSFLDFHAILIESAELLHCEKASFFLTDKKYHKDKEITLKSEKRPIRRYDEDLDQVVTETITLPVMKHARLNEYIEDPHQKMIYEFSGRDHFSFQIELFRILKTDEHISFPRCVKRVGELPKKAEQPVLQPPPQAPLKPPQPRIQLPKIKDTTKMDALIEDEEELASIENDLSLLLEEETAPLSLPAPLAEDSEEDGYTNEEEMEHIEDYDDIDAIDRPYNGYDQESDDY